MAFRLGPAFDVGARAFLEEREWVDLAIHCTPVGYTTTTFPARNEVREYLEPAVEHMSEPQRLAVLAQQSRFSLPTGFSGSGVPVQWQGDARA